MSFCPPTPRRAALKYLSLAAAGVLLAFSARAENAPGVTDTEIKIGQTMPYSGPASAYGTIGRSAAAYFATINAQGGINGRKINLISLDDGFSPPKTVEQTRRLIEQEGVAFIFQPLGTPTNVATRKYLNSKKIPTLFIAAGTTFWGDYKAWPWSMGWQPTYETESNLYADWVLKHKPAAKIALISQNDDSGRDYMGSFKARLGDKTPAKVVSDETYEVTDPTIDQQIVAAKQSGADTLFMMGNPKFAALAIRKVFDIDWHPTFFLSSTGASLATAIKPAGVEKSQGILSMLYLKDPTDPAFANDKGMQDYFAWMKSAYPEGNPIDPGNVYGYSSAQTLVQVLKQCGNDLSRANIMRQAESLDLELPLLLPGSRIQTSPTDHFPIEKVRLAKFEGDRWVVQPSE